MEIDWMDENWTHKTKDIMASNEGKKFKKFCSDIKKSARLNAKKENCFLCGKRCTSFCKSHTIPQFVLKKIASNGKLFLFNSLLENAFIECDSGIANAGNFYLICDDCDNTFFQDYENCAVLSNLKKTNSMAYCEIAVKNLLKALYKRTIEISQYKEIYKTAHENIIDNAQNFWPSRKFILNTFKRKIDICELDLREYNDEIIKCKKTLHKKSQNINFSSISNCYNVIDTIFVHYTVPVAYQGMITLVADMEGNLINDLYCDNPQYKQEMLHLCIFPLEKSSLMTLFVHKSNKRYSKFKTQFLNLSLDNKLALINYILFLYSEDMLLSGYLDISSLKTTEFQKVIRTNLTDNFDVVSKNALKKTVSAKTIMKFALNNYKVIENLLSNEYSIENLVNKGK